MVPNRKKIDLASYARRGLLEAFKDRQLPCFSTTCNVDITHLKPFIDANGHGFFMTMSYAISRAVNGVPEFRHRLIEGELYEFEQVDPGFTILLEDNTFSFCDSRYFADFAAYREYSADKISSVKIAPDVGTPEKHHMFFISSIPWFSFTSFTHPFDASYASIPIFTIGKYFQHGEQLLLPLAVQVHHGLIDGFHVGLFYDRLNRLLENPSLLDQPAQTG